MEAVDIIQFNRQLQKLVQCQILWHPTTSERGYHWNDEFKGNIQTLATGIAATVEQYSSMSVSKQPVELLHITIKDKVVYYHLN